MKRLALVAAIAAGSMTVALYCFFPCIAVWKAFDLPEAKSLPEINRAVDAWAQVQDPSLDFQDNITNKVLEWRLLFPLVGHYLGFGRTLYLALPFVGCFLTLALVAAVSYRELGQWLATGLLTCATATASWFVTSTNWLAYFDSWYMLCLFVVTAVRSRAAVLIACAAMPWIDERGLIGLPLCFAVRAGVLRLSLRTLTIDALWVAAGTLPYVIARLIAVIGGTDAVASQYAGTDHQWNVPLILLGIVVSLRALWGLVGAWLWLVIKTDSRRAGAVAAIIALASGAVLSLIAADVGRSLAVFTCAAWGGAILLDRVYPQSLDKVLFATLLANLLLPMAHVVTVWDRPIPVVDAYAQLFNSETPTEVWPTHYAQRGQMLFYQRRYEESLAALDTALWLDPDLFIARKDRAFIRLAAGQPGPALEDADELLRAKPDSHEAFYLRGMALEGLGRKADAQAAYQQALKLAPDAWPDRSDCVDRWTRLRWANP